MRLGEIVNIEFDLVKPMLILLKFLIIATLLGRLLVVIGLLVSFKAISEEEKSSPFECGFAPLAPTRRSFSLHFFLISLIFLVFDVELVLLFPAVFVIKDGVLLRRALILFYVFVRVGFLVEWVTGRLD